MGDVALKVPLRALALGRRAERHRSHHARVRLLSNPLDRPALPGGVTALEHHDDFQAFVDDPVLQTHELHLQALKLLLVASLVELLPLDLLLRERGTIPSRTDRRHCGDATASARRARAAPYAKS